MYVNQDVISAQQGCKCVQKVKTKHDWAIYVMVQLRCEGYIHKEIQKIVSRLRLCKNKAPKYYVKNKVLFHTRKQGNRK